MFPGVPVAPLHAAVLVSGVSGRPGPTGFKGPDGKDFNRQLPIN